MSRPVSRYRPSRRYYLLLSLALAGAVLSAWSGVRWPAAWLAAGGFAVSALAVLALVARPAVEIHETHLRLGRRKIAWRDIRRLDRTGWNAPLMLRLTLAGAGGPERLILIYPGDLDACRSLLRHLRRYSRQALLDGVSYQQFWGESSSRTGQLPPGQSGPAPVAHAPASQPPLPGQLPPIQTPPARYRLMRQEDEEEVERMFQRLKTEGHLEQPGPIGQHDGGPHVGPHGSPRRDPRSPEEK